MKHIGLIGGLSPESSVHYYQIICRRHNRKKGGLDFPELTLKSLNLGKLIPLFQENRWDEVARVLCEAARALQAAGADFAAILANTPHNAFDEVAKNSPLKILSIMDAVSSVIRKDKVRKVALLGTKATMEYGFFQKNFQASGIETLLPSESERLYLDQLIWNELSHGIINQEAREKTLAIISPLMEKGAEGVILGCTELPLLIRPEDLAVKFYDTTQIHAEAILEYASNG